MADIGMATSVGLNCCCYYVFLKAACIGLNLQVQNSRSETASGVALQLYDISGSWFHTDYDNDTPGYDSVISLGQ